MTTTPSLAVLGASGPEMTAIEAALVAAGVKIIHASAAGRRCHPGNAYRCDAVAIVPFGTIWIECAPESGWPEHRRTVDHRPGDPGFGRPPADFLAASSLGQILALLGVEPTAEQRMIAAADHCLGAAYAGQCPGVDPAALREFRAEQLWPSD